jgi:asparagine synthase (glutamine-hydrolysing)
MLEGVDRLIDLTGFHASGLSGAGEREIVDAVQRGDTDRLAATDGHFAAVAREGKTVRLARTIALPLRYFVAKMYHGPFLVVAGRIDALYEWCKAQHIAWQFDPAYTRMVPAHYLVEIDQVGCPDPVPRYRRFFNAPVGEGSPDTAVAGERYVRAALGAARQWLETVPAGEPIAVAFSGGVDSTAVWLLARRASEQLGRDPDLLRAFTLDFGGGADAAQAHDVAGRLGLERSWERVEVPESEYDLREAIVTIEDYHPLDVECAAAALCLLRAIRRRHPRLRYLVDGDGGDENLKSYPLEDSDLTLSSVLGNPTLYQEGWGIDAMKHSLVYSGGLSRGYMRTFMPAARYAFDAFSPFTCRSVIAEALAMPFDAMLDGNPGRLATLKQDVVRAGMRAVLGVEMPIAPKRRFQDGAHASPRGRLTKAWCRRVFDELWEDRLREADADDRRSGNETSIAAGAR